MRRSDPHRRGTLVCGPPVQRGTNCRRTPDRGVGFFVLRPRFVAEPFLGCSSRAAGGLRRIPPKTPHGALNCALLSTISVVGLVWVGPLGRSGTNGGLASRPAGAGGAVREAKPRGPHEAPTKEAPLHCRGAPRRPPRLRCRAPRPPAPKPPTHTTRTAAQRRERLDVNDVGSRQGARTRAFLGGGAGEAGARGAEGPP